MMQRAGAIAVVAVLWSCVGLVGPTEPTCSDGVQNGTETGIDCGGSCTACTAAPTCRDGVQNGTETGIDCGGSCTACTAAPTCRDGVQNGTETGIDCGGSCTACTAAPTCSDGVQNGTETGIDCGGSCTACTAAPTCSDGVQNGTETGIDCGGSCTACTAAPTCSDGVQNGTETGIDCGGSCTACTAAPTCSDGVQNGSETGIDCGGSCTACQVIEVADYYVSPTGDDSNPGTITQPFATWEKLKDVLQPGDLAYIRGGTYRTTKPHAGTDYFCYLQNFSGTASQPIRIWAYPGEKPVLNYDNVVPTVTTIAFQLARADYVWIKGLRVTGMQQNTNSYTVGFAVSDVNHTIIENCEVDHMGGYGLVVGSNSHDTLVKNCDSHHNADPLTPGYPWGGSNGFGQTGMTGSSGTVFSGCRAWWNSDDGFDLFNDDGDVVIENSWSFWNGYVPGTFMTAGDGQGFKLGPTSPMTTLGRRIVRGSIAVQNREWGFDENVGNCPYEFYNNVAWGNGAAGFFWGYTPSLPHVFRNNISFGNGGVPIDGSRTNWHDDHNSWNAGFNVTAADFMSLDASVLIAPRKADGSLPDMPFLHLAPGSALIDSGADAGLPFRGAAPDLGAFEF